MRLRPLDQQGVQAYLQEIRPRLLTLRIEAGRFRIRWMVTSWAIEEPLSFALRAFAFAVAVAPGTARALASRAGLHHTVARPTDRWRAFDELFSEADRDLLALPDGLPIVDVRTGEVRVRINETRL